MNTQIGADPVLIQPTSGNHSLTYLVMHLSSHLPSRRACCILNSQHVVPQARLEHSFINFSMRAKHRQVKLDAHTVMTLRMYLVHRWCPGIKSVSSKQTTQKRRRHCPRLSLHSGLILRNTGELRRERLLCVIE